MAAAVAAAFAGGGGRTEKWWEKGDFLRSGTGAVLSFGFVFGCKSFLDVLCWYGLALFLV